MIFLFPSRRHSVCKPREIISEDKNEQKLRFLASKKSNHAPILLLALTKGHKQAVIAYMQAIISSNLSSKQKEDLLIAEAPRGLCGIGAALCFDQYDTAAAYFTEIQGLEPNSITRCVTAWTSNLNEVQKEELWQMINELAPELLSYKPANNNNVSLRSSIGP